MKLEGKNILVISNEPWGDVWYSKHNIAYELAKNNRVFFLNPPLKWKLSGIFSSGFSQGMISDSLSVLSYRNFLPVRGNLISRINNFVVSKRLKGFLKKLEANPFIFWSFDPSRFYKPMMTGTSLSLFYAVDDYCFTMYGEKVLFNEVDYFVVISEKFLQTYLPFNKPVIKVTHGIAESFFDATNQKSFYTDIKNYGFFAGVLDKAIDYSLLEKALIRLPETQFVVAGPLIDAAKDSLPYRIFVEKQYSNLHYLGVVPFNDLKFLIRDAAFCFSFMAEDFHGNKIASHKTLLYLSHGKPVFSFAFSDYAELQELMYMSEDGETLLNALSGFIKQGESSELLQKRIEYSRQFTYDKILKIIEENLG